MKHRKIVLTVEHMKDGPDGAILGFELMPVVVGRDADGDDITSCIVRPTSASNFRADDELKLHPRERSALALLQELLDERGEAPHSKNADLPGDVKVVLRKDWRRLCKDRSFAGSVEEEAFKKAFIRARKSLEEKNLISFLDGRYVYLNPEQP